MKTARNYLGGIAVTAALFLLMSGCAVKNDSAIKSTGKTYKTDTSADKLSLADGFEEIAGNERFTLQINGTDLNIALADSVTGKTWYSNHPDAENDAVALSDTIELLKAQLQIDYYDSNGNYGTMNSYTDCVSKGQYKVYKIKNGAAIEYTLGDASRTADDVPQKISDKRFTQKILEKITDNQRKIMSNQYYQYHESDHMWEITSKGRENYKRILQVMDKVGYTAADLEQDHRQYGITVSSSAKIGFTVTVYYTLNEYGLSVSVPCEKITYNAKYPPYNISLLPNFGAQRITDGTQDGFLLLPDGSGALMQFGSGLSPEYYYDAPVYGYDEVVKLRGNTNSVRSETVSLPAFGINDGSCGILAWISDGAPNASVTAVRAGKSSEQFTANPTFSVLNMDYVQLNGSGSATTTPVFQQDVYSGNYTVEYMPTQRGGYPEMAETLRSRLQKEGLLAKSGSADSALPFYLETVGGIQDIKSKFGISYSGVVSTTSYQQNTEILQALSDRGVGNLTLKLLGWCNGGMYGKCAADINLIGALGGKSGFNSLKQYCESNQIGLFPDANLIRGGKGNGETESVVARTLDSRTATAVLRTYLSDDLPRITAVAYSPIRLLGIAERYLDSYKDLKLKTASVSDNGAYLYSDYNDTLDRQFDRAEAERYAVRQLATVAEKTDSLMVNTGNLYSLAYAQHVVNVSTDDSWMLCEDGAVPFLQLVLHGSVNLGSKPFNLQTDSKQMLLRCAEYGVAPLYQFSYAETSVLSGTDYSENYSSCYKDWIDSAAADWKSLDSVLSGIGNAVMTDHRQLAQNIFCTEYDNGICVYVNYTQSDYVTEGVTVPAESFVRKEGVRNE